MKIAHYLRSLHLTGGTKDLAQHQEIFRALGHDVYWFVRKIDTDFDFEMPIVEIANVSEMVKYDLDVLIVNKPKDYYEVKGVPAKHLVYLSQAYEIDHMNIRCEKKKRLGHTSVFGKMAMNVKWGLKKRRIHKMMALFVLFQSIHLTYARCYRTI